MPLSFTFYNIEKFPIFKIGFLYKLEESTMNTLEISLLLKKILVVETGTN